MIDGGDGIGLYKEWNFFKYYVLAIPTVWNKLSWLWFLLALFINSLVNYPLMAWSQRRARKYPVGQKDYMYVGGITLAMAIWMIPNAKLVSSNAAWGYQMPQVFLQWLYYITIMGCQLLLEGKRPVVFVALKLLGPIFMLGMNYYKELENENNI